MGRIFNPPKKVDLKTLFNSGDLTVDILNTSEDSSSDGIASIFDGKKSDGDPVLAIDQALSGVEVVKLNFSTPIQGVHFRVRVTTEATDNYSIFLNVGRENASEIIDTDDIYPGGTGYTLPRTFTFNFRVNSISEIRISLDEAYGASDPHQIYEVELFVLEDHESGNFEFNDSVLTTKAWNSSRYSGKQLSAVKINRFTAGDSTYGKTPVIQNYSRNIYIGNDIVGMSSIDGEAEDNSLLQFDNFSYAQTNTYITVNEDDSITLNTLNEPVEDDYSEIIGFYQAFYDDFKQGTYCKILMNDLSPKTNLRPSYPIWFNGGQFQKLLKLSPGNGSHLKYTVSNNIFDYNEGGTATGFSSTIYDETLLNVFYTGSLVGEIPFQPPRDGDDGNFPINSATGILSTNLDNLFTSAINYKNNSDYKGDKRFFTSFTISGSEAPVRTITTGSVVSTIFRSKNLAELSTAEFKSVDTSNHAITFTENTKLHQNYISINQTGDAMTPALHGSGSVIFSQVDDTTPSLLIELNKSSELPDGTGNKPFIIIPHNLHPYIKDNLSYFLTQAGIDVGGNTSTVLTINPSNRLLK